VSAFFPTIAEERVIAAGGKTQWRTSRVIPRVIFFVLTLVCVSAAYGLFNLFGFPEEAATATICIAVAELLIAQKRLYHAGPEEALWIAALFCMIFALPGPATDEAILLFAAAFFIAGGRVRNALFLAVGTGLVCVYVVVRAERSEPAAFLALALAFASAALLNRQWRDPLWHSLFSWLVVAMPAFAWVVDAMDRWEQPTIRIAVAIVVGIAFLLLGLWRRERAIVLAGGLSIVLAAVGIDQRMIWPGEFRFLMWGGVLLILALATERALRGKTRGLTSEKIEEIEGFALVEMAAAAAATPRSDAPPREVGRGGEFGGGGSSADY
jgi:hypothetical protein